MDTAAGPGAAGARPRILVLVNPSAGRTDAERIRDAITAGCEGTPVELEFVTITDDVRAGELTRAARDKGYAMVLVAGGDGTLAEAARGLLGHPLPLGIIPTGTGNVVATNLAIPMSPVAAARAAITGSPAPYDVGRTDDGRIFLLAAGAGYDADLIRDADRELKRRFGPLAYLFAMFKNLAVKRARFTIELDGVRRIHVHAKTVLVTNVGRTMGAVPLAPDARVDDGSLDVVVFTFTGIGQLFGLFIRALLGRLKEDPRVRFFQARQVRIAASRAMPLQVDGEFIDRTTPIEMVVLPAAIRVMRPRARPTTDFALFAESAMKVLRELPGRSARERAPGPPGPQKSG